MSNPLLEVAGLSVEFRSDRGLFHAVRDVAFTVAEGEVLCIVGESGCGKSLTSLSVMDLLPSSATRTVARLALEGRDLTQADQKYMSDIRGDRMAMIFQDPMTSLNPCYTVGDQLMEALLRHRRVTQKQARDRAVYLLEKVGIRGAGERLRQYPHQLSGGLRQRVMIAMALMCGPRLIIADEPTTALDVTVQAQILGLLADLQREFRMAMILVTHDLGVVAAIGQRVAVMYAGEIVEMGPVRTVFDAPRHPYTASLLRCIPKMGKGQRKATLGTIPGMVPVIMDGFVGCAFRNRCDRPLESCGRASIPLQADDRARTIRCLNMVPVP